MRSENSAMAAGSLRFMVPRRRRPLRVRRRSLSSGPERLEPRFALSAASTVVAGTSLNLTVPTIQNGSLPLAVSSTAGFASAGFLLVGQPGQQPFATIQYSTVNAAASQFETLAFPAVTSDQKLLPTTAVTQAAQTTSMSPATTFGGLAGQSLTVAAGTPFTGTGFVYVMGGSSVHDGGGAGIFSYNVKSSILPTAQVGGTFKNLRLVSIFGIGKDQPVGDITVPLGSSVIECSAPTPGTTITLPAAAFPTTANTPFTLPVLSTAGFARPTKGNPGVLFLGTGPNPIVVTYTGINKSGTAFTVCTTTATGRIPLNTVVTPSANAPITFTFTNNSQQGTAVYVAVAGFQSDVHGILTPGYLAPVISKGQPNFSQPLQFVSVASGTPPAVVPAFRLFSATAKTGATTSLIVTNQYTSRLVSTRVMFSMGLPPVIPILSNALQFPNAGNPTDPNQQINYDFVEFTQRNVGPNDGTLFINTSQVDQVGLPFLMNVTPGDTGGRPSGVGIKMARSALVANYATYVGTQFADDQGAPRAPAAEAAWKKLVTPYRMLNPSHVFTNPPPGFGPTDEAAFADYFDGALAQFFANYQSGEFRLQRDGKYFVGQTVTDYRPQTFTYAGSFNATTGTLTLDGIAVPDGTVPAVVGANLLVSGPGITGQAVATGQPNVAADQSTTLSLTPLDTPQTGTHPGHFTFTVPGGFTVLELKQADSAWSVKAGGETYRIYAPFFAENRPTGTVPAGLPIGTGLGSLRVAPGSNHGFTPNAVGTLVFTGGTGTNAAGSFVTDAHGAISQVVLTDPGSGYTANGLPSIGFSGAGAGTAVVTASFVPHAPPWTGTQTAGQMVFGCLGVFTDGTAQAIAGQMEGTGASGSTLLDIENTIVSAFNRGVAVNAAIPAGTDVTDFWNVSSNFYPAPNAAGTNWSNLYAGFLHQPKVSVAGAGGGGLAYGFAYDDQGGKDTTLTSVLPTAVSITLQRWKSGFAPQPLVFKSRPQVAAGLLSFQAQGKPQTMYMARVFQVNGPPGGPFTGQWQPVTAWTHVAATASGLVQASATAVPVRITAPGTYVVVLRTQAETEAFAGQYSVSQTFTVTARSLLARKVRGQR